MRVIIKHFDNGLVNAIEGEVISWDKALEMFDGVYIKVPCVTIGIANGKTITISIKTDMPNNEVNIFKDMK